jgi:hypothetical protein
VEVSWIGGEREKRKYDECVKEDSKC